MVRYRGPKNRIARRFGANIFGKSRNPLLHKANPPGVHGAKRKKKSDYGVQLDEQQKLKAVYGMITRKTLVRYYQQASRMKGQTPNVFLNRLECRLDNMVYRMKLAPSIFGAQQLVAHGHILVDGQKVDIRSFQVRPGMTISIKQKSHNMEIIKSALQNGGRDVPEYLSVEPEKMEGKLLVYPEMDQVPLPLPINIPLICEFLAHTS